MSIACAGISFFAYQPLLAHTHFYICDASIALQKNTTPTQIYKHNLSLSPNIPSPGFAAPLMQKYPVEQASHCFFSFPLTNRPAWKQKSILNIVLIFFLLTQPYVILIQEYMRLFRKRTFVLFFCNSFILSRKTYLDVKYEDLLVNSALSFSS